MAEEKKEDTMLPKECDYLVVGSGASGMAFCDSLLHGNSGKSSVVLIDQHSQPGGQWNDSYSFVRLHQPSDMYGVETEKLEPASEGEEKHRAKRQEILDYYQRVAAKLTQKFNFTFVGGATLDMQQLQKLPSDKAYSMTIDDGSSATIKVNQKVVDARYLQPDLPIHIPPKFAFDASKINCVPVNELATSNNANINHFVVIGGGKTGMDAVVYLLTKLNIAPENITWVVPHEAWITARENIGSCMEFLHTCASLAKKDQQDNLQEYVTSTDFFQNGFLQWEQEGHVYRMTGDQVPTKFKDATLSKPEMALLQKVTNVVREGRVSKILDDGSLHFENGKSHVLPASPETTLYVHCSAGAFNYSYNTTKPPPIYSSDRIVLQDVYGTPGFCFVGSLLGKLESLPLSDDEKNTMCLTPTPSPSSSPLGPSGGDIGCLTKDHGLVQRLLNLRLWLQRPELKEWLVGHRLFNLRDKSEKEMEVMVDDIHGVLRDAEIL